MIRYALQCTDGHAFESWFADSAAYDAQKERGLVSCPICGSPDVDKALMAPRLGRSARRAGPEEPEPVPAPVESAKAPVAMMGERERELRAKLREIREHLVRNSENVGARFPEEARRIHYGEVEQRSIFGEASLDEAKALHEEGIAFHPLPVLPDERN